MSYLLESLVHLLIKQTTENDNSQKLSSNTLKPQYFANTRNSKRSKVSQISSDRNLEIVLFKSLVFFRHMSISEVKQSHTDSNH